MACACAHPHNVARAPGSPLPHAEAAPRAAPWVHQSHAAPRAPRAGWVAPLLLSGGGRGGPALRLCRRQGAPRRGGLASPASQRPHPRRAAGRQQTPQLPAACFPKTPGASLRHLRSTPDTRACGPGPAPNAVIRPWAGGRSTAPGLGRSRIRSRARHYTALFIPRRAPKAARRARGPGPAPETDGSRTRAAGRAGASAPTEPPHSPVIRRAARGSPALAARGPTRKLGLGERGRERAGCSRRAARAGAGCGGFAPPQRNACACLTVLSARAVGRSGCLPHHVRGPPSGWRSVGGRRLVGLARLGGPRRRLGARTPKLYKGHDLRVPAAGRPCVLAARRAPPFCQASLTSW